MGPIWRTVSLSSRAARRLQPPCSWRAMTFASRTQHARLRLTPPLYRATCCPHPQDRNLGKWRDKRVDSDPFKMSTGNAETTAASRLRHHRNTSRPVLRWNAFPTSSCHSTATTTTTDRHCRPKFCHAIVWVHNLLAK